MSEINLKRITQSINFSKKDNLFFEIKKTILFSLGCLFFVIGFIGVFVPLLPTTPFMILAGFCFSKSSKKAYNWLLYKTGFGPAVRDWQNSRIIRTKYKVLSTTILSFSLVFIWLSKCILIVQCLLTAFFAYLTFFIWKQKSK